VDDIGTQRPQLLEEYGRFMRGMGTGEMVRRKNQFRANIGYQGRD